MRSLFLSVAFLAAAGLAALTPPEASAQVFRSYYSGGPYYSGYSYAPTYYAPAPYYTTSPYGGYTAPSVSNYYAPVYGSAPYYQTYTVTPDFRPIYSGPRYYQGYAPNRYYVYP